MRPNSKPYHIRDPKSQPRRALSGSWIFHRTGGSVLLKVKRTERFCVSKFFYIFRESANSSYFLFFLFFFAFSFKEKLNHSFLLKSIFIFIFIFLFCLTFEKRFIICAKLLINLMFNLSRFELKFKTRVVV
jgi:hypothetical protein